MMHGVFKAKASVDLSVMHTFVSRRGSLRRISAEIRCARSVHESNVFSPLGLALSEKQIPRVVGNVSS
jgi:hypothetical protein